MKLSLVLATYGRAEEFDRCLASLAAQEDRNFEVLVMDQNPDDRLAACIARFLGEGLAIRHIRLPEPGLAAARNEGIRIAVGDIIGFPDDDCWYEPHTVARIRQTFGEDDALAGVVADWVEQSDGGGNVHGGDERLLSWAAWRDFRGGAASSITLFLKRGLLFDLRGFDERLGVGKWYGAAEETDLLLRALAGGAVIQRLKDAKVHHAFAVAQPVSGLQQTDALRARGRGTGALYAKHKLALTTILRGLLAPVLKPLVRLQFGWPLRAGWATAQGRLEGMRRWRKEELET